MIAQATQEQEYDRWKEKNNDSSTLQNCLLIYKFADLYTW